MLKGGQHQLRTEELVVPAERLSRAVEPGATDYPRPNGMSDAEKDSHGVASDADVAVLLADLHSGEIAGHQRLSPCQGRETIGHAQTVMGDHIPQLREHDAITYRLHHLMGVHLKIARLGAPRLFARN